MKKRPVVTACLLATIVATGLVVYLSHRNQPRSPHPAGLCRSVDLRSVPRGRGRRIRATGMAHAFYNPRKQHHRKLPPRSGVLSRRIRNILRMTEHDGRYFQRRWQKGFDGKPDNVEELPIDYVMGSGNHVRTYLHREAGRTLIELPLAWYRRWRPLGNESGLRQCTPDDPPTIAYECMFCHNAYPQIPRLRIATSPQILFTAALAPRASIASAAMAPERHTSKQRGLRELRSQKSVHRSSIPSPEQRSPDGGLRAMSSRNHQPPAARPHSSLRPGALRLQGG